MKTNDPYLISLNHFLIITVSLLIFSCSHDSGEKEDEADAPKNSDSIVNPISQHVIFSDPIYRGKIEDYDIDEASGLAAGINNPNTLWTHNDSGGEPNIYLMDEYGKEKGTFTLDRTSNRDWEDICSGPGPDSSKNYLYIAETGDNGARYDDKYVYRIEEPIAGNSSTVYNLEKIAVRYPDGRHDAETLMIDPITKDLYIITKQESNTHVYRAPYPQSTTSIITLEKLGAIPYAFIVGGDISANGKEILIKTYDKVYYWPLPSGYNLAKTLQQEPYTPPYNIEPQGEAIAWKKDGSAYFTLSESVNNIVPILYYYKKSY